MSADQSIETNNEQEAPANYLKLRPWIFGLLIFLVANMVCLYK